MQISSQDFGNSSRCGFHPNVLTDPNEFVHFINLYWVIFLMLDRETVPPIHSQEAATVWEPP